MYHKPKKKNISNIFLPTNHPPARNQTPFDGYQMVLGHTILLLATK
jgi:hypothetical protein